MMLANLLTRIIVKGESMSEGISHFGSFIKEKRNNIGLSLRALANIVGISTAYLSDIEKGKRNPPPAEKLCKLSQALNLNEKDKSILHDLAGTGRNNVPYDLTEYIISNDFVREALRVAKDTADQKDWMYFISLLKKHKIKGDGYV